MVARKRIVEINQRVDRELAQYTSEKQKTAAAFAEARERTKDMVADWAAEPWRSKPGSYLDMTSINTRNAIGQLCYDLHRARERIAELEAKT